jgi:hypothetical protein
MPQRQAPREWDLKRPLDRRAIKEHKMIRLPDVVSADHLSTRRARVMKSLRLALGSLFEPGLAWYGHAGGGL